MRCDDLRAVRWSLQADQVAQRQYELIEELQGNKRRVSSASARGGDVSGVPVREMGVGRPETASRYLGDADEIKGIPHELHRTLVVATAQRRDLSPIMAGEAHCQPRLWRQTGDSGDSGRSPRTGYRIRGRIRRLARPKPFDRSPTRVHTWQSAGFCQKHRGTLWLQKCCRRREARPDSEGRQEMASAQSDAR